MPFADESFDLVMCRSVLEHCERPEVVFGEIARVLTPGGLFVFLTPNWFDYVSLCASVIPNRMHGWLVRRMTGRDEADTFPTRYRANTYQRICRLGAESGLEVVALDHLREGPHYLQFNSLLYLFGTAYETTIQRFLPSLRPWMLGLLRRRIA